MGIPSFPVLSIVSPTYNERDNIQPLVEAIATVMGQVAWELIVVDDDSPDGTFSEVGRLAQLGFPIRGLRRIDRRGLASAVVEGVMASSATFVAVIDADMQHDETRLPVMLQKLQDRHVDLVIGSRHVEGGGLGDWSRRRRSMSALATWFSRLIVGSGVSDPMSGFFMTRRSVFEAAIYDLSQQGYKILLDLMTSSPRPLAIVEVPYVFRDRRAGDSKVDYSTVMEYGFLLVEKATHGLVPPKFVLFSFVGGLGLLFHLVILNMLISSNLAFLEAQTIATICAMAFNYVLNNELTYRSDRLKGWRFLLGYLTFCAVCSLGALANISAANLTMTEVHNWPLAGIIGAIMSSVFNFGVSTRFVWRRPRRIRPPENAEVPAPVGSTAVYGSARSEA